MRVTQGIRSVVLTGLFALAMAVPAGACGEREKQVSIKDCPDAVLRMIRAQAGGGRIVEIEKEIKKCGRVVYEAEVKRRDGVTLEVEVACCGKLLEVEVDD